MSLEHEIICRDNIALIDTEWENVSYRPLAINDIEIQESKYLEIHDDIIHWYYDFFMWINMYNPSRKENTKGFCYWGVTIIKDKNLIKLEEILELLVKLFDNAPEKIILTGSFNPSVDGNGYYNKIKCKKEKLIKQLEKFKLLTHRAIEKNGYILHLGI
ncbi:hypothetical protein FACS1894164_02620 [Spirochaetia bacterium]|nr:hypothetical protein FACS1894164_02620 [Spirochaetia bacterium]